MLKSIYLITTLHAFAYDLKTIMVHHENDVIQLLDESNEIVYSDISNDARTSHSLTSIELNINNHFCFKKVDQHGNEILLFVDIVNLYFNDLNIKTIQIYSSKFHSLCNCTSVIVISCIFITNCTCVNIVRKSYYDLWYLEYVYLGICTIFCS